jgi:hypothetical protein
MPRYRFNWLNLPDQLLDDLARDLQLEGEPHEALRSWYGARPKPDFVQDAWPTLLQSWLVDDRVWAGHVAKRLRARNLGDTAQSSDVAYLRSLRNSSGLRQIVLDVFIEFGELTSSDRATVRSVHNVTGTATPRPAPTPMSAPVGSSTDETDDDLDEDAVDADDGEDTSLFEFVAAVLADRLGAVQVDGDGDFVIPVGSAITYVRVLSEPPAVRVFAVLLREVTPSPRVFELVNSINGQLLLGRVFFVQGAVVLEHNLLPMGLSADEIFTTLGMIANAADYFDDLLRDEIGGVLAGHEPVEGEIEV